MPQKIGLVVADDHPLTSVAIRALVRDEDDLTWLGEAASFDETQRLCLELHPNVLLLAANIITPSPIKLLSSLCGRCPTVKALILAADYSDMDLRQLVAAGVAGCVLKDEAPETILLAIRSAAQGSLWFSQSVGQELMSPESFQPVLSNNTELTARESEVLQLVAKGFSNRKIANELGIKKRTASFHVSNILQKLGVASRVEAAIWTMEYDAT